MPTPEGFLTEEEFENMAEGDEEEDVTLEEVFAANIALMESKFHPKVVGMWTRMMARVTQNELGAAAVNARLVPLTWDHIAAGSPPRNRPDPQGDR